MSARPGFSGATSSQRRFVSPMKVYDFSSREHYDQGLKRIRGLIDQTLIAAGAQMGTGCISCPPWRNRKEATESIVVVPWDSPKMTVEFNVIEIMDSRDGVESAAVLQKVGLYVSEYVRFRQSPDKLALVGGRFSGAQTTDS